MEASRYQRRLGSIFGLTSALLFFAMACHDGASAKSPHFSITQSDRIANLHAFARLYGVVRWFHPSDAATEIDWDRFAIEGARRVIDAPDSYALHTILKELFAPVGRSVQITDIGDSSGDSSIKNIVPPPSSTRGSPVVAWQHKGYGDSRVATGYVSKRTNRDKIVAVPGVLVAALQQSVNATPYRGAQVRLRGKLRAANSARARLWMRIDRGDVTGFYETMAKNPVLDSKWTEAEIIGTADDDATQITFGAMMVGGGIAWYDDIELAARTKKDEEWKIIEIQNNGFESLNPLTDWKLGFGHPTTDSSIDGWNITLDHTKPASGHSSLRIEPATKILTENLFAKTPEPNEIYKLDLGRGLQARIPIALYSKNNRTLGDDPDIARRYTQAMPSLGLRGSIDATTAVADVIVVWNVLQHFWPYWNEFTLDWDAELNSAISASLTNHNISDHAMTLRRLSAAAPDGHAVTSCPGEPNRAYLPLAVDLIDDQIVVTASVNKAIELGDIVTSVDGQPAVKRLNYEEAFVSGSPQWRLINGLRQLGSGPKGSTLTLRIRRKGIEHNIEVKRIDHILLEEPLLPAIKRFSDGVYYVDLSRAAMSDIDTNIVEFAKAPGVIFDLRGRPNSNHQVISYLLSHPDDGKDWMAIPLIIRPFSVSSPSAWDTSSWNMPVLQPHIRGRVAFLTGPAAISYSESVLGYVEYYHLGEIVGSTTAGTNGDIVQISEPSGCTTYFTGRRVTKLDGSRHHLIGIHPTIPASRTIAGVVAGEDEILEKGLAYVRGTIH